MPDGHCADPSLPLHLDQGRGSSKTESFSLRVSPALYPPERPSPRRADMAGHGHGSGNAGISSRYYRMRTMHYLLTTGTPCTSYKATPTMCVCVFSSHPFWTSMDVPAGVTQEEGHTGFLIHLPSAVRALIFVARRIQPFLSLVDREVEFCVLTN